MMLSGMCAECRLTNPSSATEAGEDRSNDSKTGCTASLCSLERVVRPAPTERLCSPEEHATRRRGNDGRCRRERVNGGTGVLEGKMCRRKNGNTLDCGGTGARSPSKNLTQETQGLTTQAQPPAGRRSSLNSPGTPPAPAVGCSDWLGLIGKDDSLCANLDERQTPVFGGELYLCQR